MLFCRSRSVAVLFSLIGSVWCATTPVPQGHWLRGRTRGISKTVQPDDYPVPMSVLRGEVLDENSSAWISASSDSDGTLTDDIPPETNTDEMLPTENPTTFFQTQGISKTVPSDDHPMPTSVLREDSEENSTARIGASSDSGGTKGEDIAPETDTDEMFPPEKHTTTLIRTEDDFRTRRGTVLVDDDFNVSPEPGVNQGWSDGAVKSTKPSSSTIDEGSGQEEEPPSPTPSPDSDGSGDDEPTESWMNFCLNSTCSSRDLSVFPGHDEIVPVGTNLTLSCVKSNESVVDLRWYKYDDDGNPLLQTISDIESELTFAISKSRTEDSGRYVCVRTSTTGSCCHRTLHVKVYEVPNYRYHLIVVGVVAAVSLFACLLLGVCRNYKTKKYEVQLELQNMESDCVYKM